MERLFSAAMFFDKIIMNVSPFGGILAAAICEIINEKLVSNYGFFRRMLI